MYGYISNPWEQHMQNFLKLILSIEAFEDDSSLPSYLTIDGKMSQFRMK